MKPIFCGYCGKEVKKPRMKQIAAARRGRVVCCTMECRKAFRAKTARDLAHTLGAEEVETECPICGVMHVPSRVAHRVRAAKGGKVPCKNCESKDYRFDGLRPVCPFENGSIPAYFRQGMML